MDMKNFINFCKAGNPISGENKELHDLLVQSSYEAQKDNNEIKYILLF
ncbi:hypothetical protein ACT7C4_13475 [Bacillus pacificus]